MKLPRLLNPTTNWNGILAGASAVIAIVTGIQHHQHVPSTTWYAAASFVGFALSWFLNTPVADPKDGKGNPLTAAPPPAPPSAAPPIVPMPGAKP